MNRSINFYKDIIIGCLYLTGVFGFMSGEFIISATMIGAASLISNFDFREATPNDSRETV